MLVTYGEVAKDRPDVYQQDSLTWDGAIVLNEMHSRQQAIKRFLPYVQGAELRVDFPLPPTQRGRDAAYMVKDGTYTGLSIEVARDSIVATYRAGVQAYQPRKACGCGPGRRKCVPGEHGRGQCQARS